MNGGTDWKGTIKDTLTERAQLDFIGTRGTRGSVAPKRVSRPGDLFRTQEEIDEMATVEPVRRRRKTGTNPWDIKRNLN